MAPTRNEVFTVRESLLTEIHQTLADGELVALSGLGEIGKTAAFAISYRVTSCNRKIPGSD